MRRALVAFALLVGLAVPVQAGVPKTHWYPSTLDYRSNAWVTFPDSGACTDATKTCGPGASDSVRWTLDRLATMGRSISLFSGGDHTLGIPGRLPEVGGEVVPDYQPRAINAFGLHFFDGRNRERSPDITRWLADARSRPGGDRTIHTYSLRYDIAYRENLTRIGEFAMTPSMLLRTDRPLADLAASFAGGIIADTDTGRCGGDGTDCGFSMCRGPQQSSIVVGELYGQATEAGCGQPYDGTSNKERGVRIDEVAAALGADPEHVAYYIARPDSGAKVFYPYAVMTDMLDEDFQALIVRWCARAIELGFDACDFPHKNHYFRSSSSGTGIFDPPPEHWPIADDAFGGYATMSDFVAAETPFSGPPERLNGDQWNYARRKLAEVQIARLLDAAALPTVVTINPYWFEGCPKDYADWDTAYDDAACDGTGESDDGYDDQTTDDEEDAYQREIVARADWCLVQTGGKVLSGADGGLGSGSGSGFSYQELRQLVHSMTAPDGTPCVVIGYEDGSAIATPPKYYQDPSEDNPETDLEECGDGDIAAGEECDDGNTTSGDGCDQWCRLPDVFVIAGQSNAFGYSIEALDVAGPPRVTSPDSTGPATGLSSQNYRYRYTDPGESAGGDALATLNDWPCADVQCTGTECTGTNRTAAGHPDTNAGDGDGTCSCFCGSHGSAFASWEGASPWPTFAQRYMQDFGREVFIVDVTKGGQSLVSGANPWFSPSADCSLQNTDYDDQAGDGSCGIYRAAELAGVEDRVKAVLFVQGEADASAGVTSADYQAGLSALSDLINAEYGRTVPLMLTTISRRFNDSDACTDGSGIYERIKIGQENAIEADPDIYRGSNLDDVFFDTDLVGGTCTHYSDQQLHGERWYEAVRSLLTGQEYDGGIEAPSGSVVAAFTATPVDTVCVAPCVIHFDATATDDTDLSREFHELTYEWDFDDAAVGGTWSTGAAALTASPESRNADRGPIAAHVYTVAGTYDPILNVRAPDGDEDQHTTSIVVTASDTRFSGSETWCFSNDSDFTGCPSGATQVSSSSDYDAALATCLSGTAERRCLFKVDDAWTADSSTTFGDPLSAGNIIHVGSFGTGAAPSITTTFDGAVHSMNGDGVTIFGLDFTGSGSGATGDGATIVRILNEKKSVAWIDSTVRTIGGGCYGHQGTDTDGDPNTAADGDEFSDLIAAVDIDCELSVGEQGYPFFMKAARFIVLGSIADNNTSEEFNFRTIHNYKSVIAHNTFREPGVATNRNNVQLRAWGGTGGCTPDCDHDVGPIATDSQYIYFADNDLAHETGATQILRLTQNNEAANPGSEVGAAAEMIDVLIENNRFALGDGFAGSFMRVIQLQGGKTTVRNNVVDLQGTHPSGTITFLTHAANAATELTEDDEITVTGNTIYWDDTTTGNVVVCDSGSLGTGHVCQLNLVYAPGHSTGTFVDDSGTGWSTATGNDLRRGADPDPFDTSIPAPPTDPSDFVLDAASTAKDLGVSPASGTSLNVDFGGLCRPAGASRDAGAWEQGASTCP